MITTTITTIIGATITPTLVESSLLEAGPSLVGMSVAVGISLVALVKAVVEVTEVLTNALEILVVVSILMLVSALVVIILPAGGVVASDILLNSKCRTNISI